MTPPKKKYRSKVIFDYCYDNDPQPHWGVGFLNCDSCGELFEGFGMGDQEIDYWEQHPNFNLDKMSSYTAYELHEIFDHYDDKEKLEERVVALAKKLIEQNEMELALA